MPISFQIDRAQRRVNTTVTGAVTADDIIGHLEAARREDTLSYCELIDTLQVTPPFLSTLEISRAAHAVTSMPLKQKYGPRAVIVAGDAIYGTARMFATLVEDYFPIRVFREHEKAEEWLAAQKPAT